MLTGEGASVAVEDWWRVRGGISRARSLSTGSRWSIDKSGEPAPQASIQGYLGEVAEFVAATREGRAPGRDDR